MKILVTRPQHDITTRYLASWAGEIIDFARKKGIEVLDLVADKAHKSEFEGRIKKLSPSLIFLNGHGSDSCVTGHDNSVLIEAEKNYAILAGRITYALSCNSGRILGAMVASHASSAYIGYKDKFIFVCDRNYLSKISQDPRAEPFKDSSNQVMISLLKGHSAAEASRRSRETFREQYVHLLASNTDQDSLQAAQFLWWNRKNQVCLGEQNLSTPHP